MTEIEKKIKQLENQFITLTDSLDKIDNNNSQEICDLQTRIRRLEDTKSNSSDDSSSKNFWEKCLGILCVSVGIIFAIELAVIVILSKIGLC